jgi:glycosyltransferase involved in cell wall biosynthesis
MSLVTFTDHNAIGGCLEVAGLPGTFISEEVTTYFPSDRCKVHVLVYGITEAQHEELQRTRESVFDLVAYLRGAGVVHALAHPLYQVNERLEADHIEQLLLLFDVLEINGDQHEEQNALVRALAEGLDREDIGRLAQRHGIEPVGPTPWRKGLVSGSDDHSGLYIASSHTEVEGAGDVAGFLAGVGSRRAAVHCRSSTPKCYAHKLYSVAYQFYRERFCLDRRGSKDILLQVLDRLLVAEPEGGRPRASGLGMAWESLTGSRARKNGRSTVLDTLRSEAVGLIAAKGGFVAGYREVEKTSGPSGGWFHLVNALANRVFARLDAKVVSQLIDGDIVSVFQTLGSAGALSLALSPYLVSFASHQKHRRLGREVRERLGLAGRAGAGNPPPARPGGGGDGDHVKVAHFTDTFTDVNGVALTLGREIRTASMLGRDRTVVTCVDAPPGASEGAYNFRPIGVHDLPEYPEFKLCYPPLLEVLDYCYAEDFTHIHAATPGPVGLAALVAARILDLPFVTTHHTDVARYAGCLGEDGQLEDLLWEYVAWFCNRADLVLVPSGSTGRDLVDHGVAADRTRFYDRGVDSEAFHPRYESAILRERFGLRQGTNLLYVGRISREKNLPLLVQAFRDVCRAMGDVNLVVTGDGPYLDQMRLDAAGLPCRFTGRLSGRDLSEVFASADVFVFPSTTDTFGNVVLEAQASGTPVIVTDAGGPAENMVPGETGLVVRGRDGPALVRAVLELAADPDRVFAMGLAARKYAEARSFTAAFDRASALYHEATRFHRLRHASPGEGAASLGSGAAQALFGVEWGARKAEPALADWPATARRGPSPSSAGASARESASAISPGV